MQNRLEYNQNTGLYTDPYNGTNYASLDGEFVPCVAGGLPAQLEQHNNQYYMVSDYGAFPIKDGEVAHEPLRSPIDQSPLHFNQSDELVSDYNDYQNMIINGRVVTAYDTENNMPATFDTINGETFVVSEAGSYQVSPNGDVLFPSEIQNIAVKDYLHNNPELADQYFFSGNRDDIVQQAMENFENANPEQEQTSNPEADSPQSESTSQLPEMEGVAQIEEACENVPLSAIEQTAEVMSENIASPMAEMAMDIDVPMADMSMAIGGMDMGMGMM